ncbi:class I SAM-dependent methyltransferase [Oceanobacillus massiliensis]|uniref:class I SAM-dependent methyltransferase n=1 Tax=Oceanobacillus massiliensis TaxID=1465765 RepID=UPI000289BFE1|nr:class I SAM-dependent methyltransferase [Oceanobacillus massiliensis]
MGIDFHDKKNQTTYSTRIADQTWREELKQLVAVENISNAADIGCGGGIYSKALSDMGAESVTGIDFSEAMLKSARDNCKEYKNIIFKHGNALETGLESNYYDLLLERALIHHIKDLKACFSEGYRVLRNGGIYIIQDRTPEDCILEGNDSHIRGYFTELFPKLIAKEISRRYDSQTVVRTLKEAGFNEVQEVKFWETRKVHENKEQLLKDLSGRTGRSILHDLDDYELKLLINHINESVSIDKAIIEKDRWTIWKAVK